MAWDASQIDRCDSLEDICDDDMNLDVADRWIETMTATVCTIIVHNNMWIL